jgi:hypothetical protein
VDFVNALQFGIQMIDAFGLEQRDWALDGDEAMLCCVMHSPQGHIVATGDVAEVDRVIDCKTLDIGGVEFVVHPLQSIALHRAQVRLIPAGISSIIRSILRRRHVPLPP